MKPTQPPSKAQSINADNTSFTFTAMCAATQAPLSPVPSSDTQSSLVKTFDDQSQRYLLSIDIDHDTRNVIRQRGMSNSTDTAAHDYLCVKVNETLPCVLNLGNQVNSLHPSPYLLALVNPVDVLQINTNEQLRIDVLPKFKPDAVVFDVDGTLVDSLNAYYLGAVHAAKDHDLEVPWPMIKRAINENRFDFWNMIVPEHFSNRDSIAESLTMKAKSLWPALLESEVRLMSGTDELLPVLARAGIGLGVVTSSGGGSMQAMTEAGLTESIGAIVTRHDVSELKPSPEGIHKVLATIGATTGGAAYVGDTIMDIRAAHNAGVTAIAVLCGAGDPHTLLAEKPDYLLSGPRNVLDICDFE